MAPITPFTISVPDGDIKTLHQKLSLSRFPDEPEDAGWSQGAPLARIKALADHWENSFDWRKAEADLNQLPQFTTKVEAEEKFGELDLHFVHARSKVEGAIPLLFVHGWPGSFIEVKKLLPLLTQGGDDYPAFHIVAPSLPGYGFSEAPKLKGFGIKQYATTMHKLMLKLGYNEYVTQGGDWGSIITRTQGHLFPEAVLASHLNFFPYIPQLSNFFWHPIVTAQVLFSYFTSPSEFTTRIKRAQHFDTRGSGYSGIHRTKPQTIAYSLADSPVGLLGWLFEKLHDWTDAYPWTDDEVCTWVSIYYFSRAGPGASVRIYYEAAPFNTPEGETVSALLPLTKYIPGPKLGLSHFPGEVAPMPFRWARFLGPVVQERDHDRGGHFAAWEVPEVVVRDVRDMFKKGGPCFEIVEGKTGYN